MKQSAEDGKLIREYLLGGVSPEKQRQLEERLLTNDQSFQELLISEDELIDDYLAGALSEQEQKSFDQKFLAAPERQRSLQFARSLHRYVASAVVPAAAQAAAPERRPHSWLDALSAFLGMRKSLAAFSLAAAVLLMVAGGGWLFLRMGVPSRQSPAERVVQTSPREKVSEPQISQQGNEPLAIEPSPPRNGQTNSPAEQSAQNTPPNRNPVAPGQVKRSGTTPFVVMLASGLIRDGGEMKKFSVPRKTGTVQLQLDLGPDVDDYQSYRATLESEGGHSIPLSKRLRASTTSRGKVIILNVPAGILKASDYQLKLNGQTPEGKPESAGTYTFRVLPN